MSDPQTPRYYVAQNHVELHRERWDVYRQVGATPSYEHDTLVCEARERLDANRIAAALDIVALQPRLAAMNADYLDLFAHVFELKKQCAALMHERDIALSALDTALDRIASLNLHVQKSLEYCAIADSTEAVGRIYQLLKGVEERQTP